MTSPSIAWNSATALRNRSRLSRRADAAGPDRRGELDVDARRVDDAPDDVEDRLPGVRPERAELGGEQGEALQRLGEYAALAGILERIAERRQLGGVDAVGDLGELVADRGALGAPAPPPASSAARSLSSLRSRGPMAQRGPVSRVSTDGVGGDVVEQLEHRDDLGHLGQAQQPGEPDDLDRDAGRREGVEDRLGGAVVAGQHADVGPGASASAWSSRTASASHASSSSWVSKTRAATGPSAALRLRLERTRPARSRRRADRRARWRPARMRRSERRLTVSGSTGHVAVPRLREGLGEVEDVGHRGAAPAVDRLVGVADRRHRVARPWRVRPGEQAGQHPGLGDRGVLVLVEQHHPEPGPLERAHVGLLLGQPGAEGDLVGEVHQPEVGLQPAVGRDQLQQLAAPVDRGERLLDGLAVGLARLARALLLEGAR